MAFAEDLIAVARREWTRWGGPVVRLDGSRSGFASSTMENEHPYWTYVGDYWGALNSDQDGRDPPAWSAAFISYCFKEAGAGGRFPYQDNHSRYVAQIEASRDFGGLTLMDPETVALTPGDLIWAARSGDGCRTPPATFAAARTEVRRIYQGTAGSFCSHSDIVVAVHAGQTDVIGGNVKQAVTRTTYKLDAQGRISDGRRNFIGVIRNTL
jgi:hypothetical protein